MVLEQCTTMLDKAGQVVDLTASDKAHLLDVVNDMASRGLRTLAITFADYPNSTPPDESPDYNLTVMAIVGIKVGWHAARVSEGLLPYLAAKAAALWGRFGASLRCCKHGRGR